MIAAKPPKPKACKACRVEFQPMRRMQVACSPLCAQAVAEAKRFKAERAETRKALAAIKPRSKWLQEAQAAVNRYVRARDADKPCISCGRHHQGSHDAGHYLTTGARPELRFDLANIHKQCVPCNRHLHGNLIAYRIGLIGRIGVAEVERLEGNHPAQKWDIPTLKLIRDTYRQKARELEAQQQLKEAA